MLREEVKKSCFWGYVDHKAMLAHVSRRTAGNVLNVSLAVHANHTAWTKSLKAPENRYAEGRSAYDSYCTYSYFQEQHHSQYENRQVAFGND